MANWKGREVSDILKLDEKTIKGLGEKELRGMVKQLADAANKRYRNLEKKGIKSVAMSRADRSGGLFSSKGKNKEQLKAELLREREFMKQQTSTVKGYKKWVKNNVYKLQQMGIEIKPESYDRFFNLFDELKEQDPSVANKFLRYRVMPEVISQIEKTDKTDEQILADLERGVSAVYEQQEQQEHLSNWFANN